MIAGVLFTFAVMVKGDPVQVPVTETGVTVYSANPARVPGLVRIWSMVEPDPALAPVMPPVTVPMVQLKVAAIFEVRLIPVPVPEHRVRLEALVTDGAGFTVKV